LRFYTIPTFDPDHRYLPKKDLKTNIRKNRYQIVKIEGITKFNKSESLQNKGIP